MGSATKARLARLRTSNTPAMVSTLPATQRSPRRPMTMHALLGGKHGSDCVLAYACAGIHAAQEP